MSLTPNLTYYQLGVQLLYGYTFDESEQTKTPVQKMTRSHVVQIQNSDFELEGLKGLNEKPTLWLPLFIGALFFFSSFVGLQFRHLESSPGLVAGSPETGDVRLLFNLILNHAERY